MKLLSLSILRWNNDTKSPIVLDEAFSLEEFSMFTRGSIRDFLSFAARTVMQRIGAGTNAVNYEGHILYCLVLPNGLGAIAAADEKYPGRVAVTLLKEVLAAFERQFSDQWRSVTKDASMPLPGLKDKLKEYQDPTRVDRVLRVENQLADTKEILHRTIDKVLERGEKIDDLVAKSDHLSNQSKIFFKQAKKTNKCCTYL